MMHADINGIANGAGRFGDTGGLWMVSTRKPCVRRTGAAMPVGVSTIRYGLEVPADAGKYGRPVVRVSADQTPFESPWAFMRGRAVSDGDSTSPYHALCGRRRLPSPVPRAP